jgi:hypothetical protein
MKEKTSLHVFVESYPSNFNFTTYDIRLTAKSGKKPVAKEIEEESQVNSASFC